MRSIRESRGRHGVREYPPSPYPPKSKANDEYRDGWDDGFDLLVERGLKAAYDRWVSAGWWRNPTPYQDGFEDGAKEALRRRMRARGIDWKTFKPRKGYM